MFPDIISSVSDFEHQLGACVNAMSQDDAIGQILVFERTRGTLHMRHIASADLVDTDIDDYELLKDLGWRMHSESYERLKQSISRLKANELKIQVKTGKSGYAGSLIREYAWDAISPDGDKKYMVRFEPMIAELFRDDSVTFLAWEQRKMIGSRATLALWLHAFFTSHREPLPITIQKIHELTGSEQKEIRFFRRKVREALDRLKDIEFLADYAIDGDTVRVKKVPQNLLNLKSAATRVLI